MEKRNYKLIVRLTETERRNLFEKAEKSERKVSEFIRYILKKVKIQETIAEEE